MKAKQMNLRDLLINKLHALYDIEQTIVKALPKLAKAATDPELKKGFLKHLEETKTHVKRLEDAHALLDSKPKKLLAEAIRGLVKDGEWVIKEVEPKEAKDSNLARAAQYVEHYEMAGYMAAIDWAKTLGEKKVAEILNQTLKEEIAADKALAKAGNMIDKKIK